MFQRPLDNGELSLIQYCLRVQGKKETFNKTYSTKIIFDFTKLTIFYEPYTEYTEFLKE